MSMSTLLQKALAPTDKVLADSLRRHRPGKKINPAKQQFVRHRVTYRDLAKRWFAFNTPCGRVARQSIIVPNKSWTRVGDEKGYADAKEAMKCELGDCVPTALQAANMRG